MALVAKILFLVIVKAIPEQLPLYNIS